MGIQKMQAYLFDEDFMEKYLVEGLPIKKEYFVDEGFYALKDRQVIYACPECGELVEEEALRNIAFYIPETKLNRGFLESRGIDLEEDMLAEALECYELHLQRLDLEPFAMENYLQDLDAFQYVVEFGDRQVAFDVAKRLDVCLLEQLGEIRLYEWQKAFIVTESYRVIGEFSSLEEAKSKINN